MNFAELEQRFAAPQAFDVYAKCAALYYNVPESEVSAIQRSRVRRIAFPYAYGDHRGAWPAYLQPLRDTLHGGTQ